VSKFLTQKSKKIGLSRYEITNNDHCYGGYSLRRTIERFFLGALFPIMCSALILSVAMISTRQNISVIPETIGTFFGFGFIVMGIPAFIASSIAELLNRRVKKDSRFYWSGIIVGIICSLIFVIISGDVYIGIIWIILGAVMGGMTAILIRLHYNKYSANKAFKSDTEKTGAV